MTTTEIEALKAKHERAGQLIVDLDRIAIAESRPDFGLYIEELPDRGSFKRRVIATGLKALREATERELAGIGFGNASPPKTVLSTADIEALQMKRV